MKELELHKVLFNPEVHVHNLPEAFFFFLKQESYRNQFFLLKHTSLHIL